jgi:hypothetical protein
MRAQYPDSLIAPGLSDQTRILASIQCWPRPTSVALGRICGPRNFMGSVTR